MSATKYALAALDRETEAVALAGEGERNNRLNQAAYVLGQLVAGGEIDRPDVEAALVAAARSAGLDEHDAMPTIESGLRGGAKSPRRAPESDPASERRLNLPAAPPDKSAPRQWTPEPDPHAPAGVWQERASALVAWAAAQLDAAPDRLDWLQARGIRPETARAQRLGHNPGEKGRDIYRPRETWGLPEEISPRTNKPKKLWVPQGLIIPLTDPDGRVLRVRIRRDEGEPRYYVLPGSSMAPLVLDTARRVAVVVESELDAILIHQEAGDLVNAIALGNSSRKPTASAHRLLQNCGRILCAFDCDDAGATALAWWMDHYPQAAPLFAPAPHKDAGELAASGGSVRSWVKEFLPQGLAAMADNKPPVWTPPKANRHPEPEKTTPWNNVKPQERRPAPPEPAKTPPGNPASDPGSDKVEAWEDGPDGWRPKGAGVRQLRELLARCKKRALYAALNPREGAGGRGCINCGPGGTSCGLEYEVGAVVCNDEWVQDYVREKGGVVRL